MAEKIPVINSHTKTIDINTYRDQVKAEFAIKLTATINREVKSHALEKTPKKVLRFLKKGKARLKMRRSRANAGYRDQPMEPEVLKSIKSVIRAEAIKEIVSTKPVR